MAVHFAGGFTMFDIFFRLCWFLHNSESPSGRALFDQKLQDKIFQVFKALGAKSPTTLQEVVDLQMRPSQMMPAKCAFFHPRSWPIPANAGLVLHLILLEYSLAALPVKVFLPNPTINRYQQYVFNDFNYQLWTQNWETKHTRLRKSDIAMSHSACRSCMKTYENIMLGP